MMRSKIAKRLATKRGCTLIEMLTVLFIVAILAAVIGIGWHFIAKFW